MSSLSGCYYLQSPVDPIPYEFEPSSSNTQSDDVLILLPGIGDYASAYRKRGFIDMLHQSGREIDVISVNAHFKYYQNKTFLKRLHEDIILSAKQKGYKKIHLGGISLGGFGALLFLREHPEMVDSVIVLAPYMGENEHYVDFLRSQQQGGEVSEAGNLWPWLFDTSNTNGQLLEKIYLAYGLQDSFADDNAILASLIPDDHTQAIRGGHDWPTWTTLWQNWLSDDVLPF
ncbi:hypothetical protein NBRC116494_10740 [Aurantivibrio plasticivorans]